MLRALYTSGVGMTTQMKRMDVLSNNIANADTIGFKRDGAVTQSFSEELLKRLDDPKNFEFSNQSRLGKMSQGVFVDTVYTDFSAGHLRQTSGVVDMAVAGTGFFAISVTDKNGNQTENYTRDGSFVIGANRTLQTKEGNIVLGQNGPIVLPDGHIFIGERGDIAINGELVDQLKMVDFENPQSLRKQGDNLFASTNESTTKPFTGTVLQGHLENSNINTVREMVDLITVSRAYETNQKMVTIHDTTLGKAVTEIGRK